MKSKYSFIPYIIFLTIISLTIGYSAFGTEMMIGNISAEVRIEKDIRVSGINIDSFSSEGLSNYEDYNVESISTNADLPNEDSTITYKVGVTNYGNVEMGIYQLTGLNENLTYEIEEYDLKDKICDDSNSCTLGAKKEFLVTIKYKDNCYDKTNTNFNIGLIFDFRPIYKITYSGITNNGYQTEIIEGDDLQVTFTGSIPKKVIPYYGDSELEKYDYDRYTYENNTIAMSNITNDIILKYVDKVYLTTLSQGTYFKESDHLTNIKTVEFVDYIKVPSNAIESYDLSEKSDNSIIGWIDENYNLYIGSDWDIYAKDLSNAFYGMSGMTNILFNNLNTSENTNFNKTFYDVSSLSSMDISSFNTANVTNMAYMFYGMTSLESLDLSNFNTSKVTTMKHMFENLSKITTLNVNNFNTSKVTEFASMFAGMSSLTSLDLSNFKTSKATRMESMFWGLSKVSKLDLSSFDTSNVTNMYGMFHTMSNLTDLNISSFNTSKVTSMKYMFHSVSVSKLDLKHFNTSKVTDMRGMFYGMRNLTTLDISSFETTNVTTMRSMFSYLDKLTSLDLKHFDTSNVTDMQTMFHNSISLTSLDLSNFDTSKVTNMHQMFYYCPGLMSLDLSGFDTSKVTDMYQMFYKNSKLRSIKLDNATFTNVTSHAYMFNSYVNDFYIVVKDNTARDWLTARLNELNSSGTIVTVAELS